MTDAYEDEFGRGGLPSDDEDGPLEHDDAADARAPDEVLDGEEVQEMDTEPTEPVTAAPTPPSEPPDLQKITVPLIKEHLMWRGVKPRAGNKAEVLEQLRGVVEQPYVSLEQYVTAGGSATVAAPKGPAQRWQPIDAAQINRPVFSGPDKFEPNPELGWTPKTHPFTFMEGFYPKRLRDLEVENSARYRGWIKAMATEIYKGMPDITARTNALAHCTLLLQGLNPVPDQRRMWSHSFAFKGHRSADLLTRDEWKMWKAYFHISDPRDAPAFGSKDWDELHKVRPMLDEYLRNCVANVMGGIGKTASIDEITIGFQGHHARLKLRCGKFKRAGDGFQADAIVLEGGYVLFLVFRGDNTLPVFEKRFSPLHNRCALLLSKLLQKGHHVYWDNLYPSVEVAQTFARGGEYTATVPAGPKAGESVTITVPPTGTCGTARPNRLGGAPCTQPKKQGLSEKAIAAIKAKPLEERVKSAMTMSEPRVICASVFDNGPVHILDTIHTSAGIVTIHKPRAGLGHAAGVRVRASTGPPSTALTLPNVGPLGGVDGTDACPRCGAWRFPGEKLECCLPHPSGRGPAFVPFEVDLFETEELCEVDSLFRTDAPVGKHFRKHSHLINSVYSYASLKRLAKRDFDEDMVDETAWDAEAGRWRAALQPMLDARGMESTEELDDGELLELASRAMPMASGWDALYAEHADDFDMLS